MSNRIPNSGRAIFDLDSSQTALRKLTREIGRIRAATGREDLADACTNAAWSAWHLTEWVWADIKHDYLLKAKLAKEAGVMLGDFDVDAFKLFVQSEGQCPDLSYCRIITTTSKHSGAKHHADDPTFVVTASTPSSGAVRMPTLDWQPIYDTGSKPVWVFKIVKGDNLDGQDRSNAASVIENIHDYWTRFIRCHIITSA